MAMRLFQLPYLNLGIILEIIHLSTQFVNNPAINFDRSHQPPHLFLIFLGLLDILSEVAHDPPQKNKNVVICLGQNLLLVNAENGNSELDENFPSEQNE